MENRTKPHIVKEINIKYLLDEEIEYFKLFASKKAIELEYKANDTLFNIDEESFKRLTNNLISNALKYTKKNGKVSILLSNNKLTISDNGCGIAKDDIKNIYNRFYRANNTTGGFGIGLNIVNTICKEFNIKIDIKSQIGEGTKFELIF